MTEPEHGSIAEEARRWFRYAVEDLGAAERQVSDGLTPPRHVCYLSQQAAEKAIKAILVLLQIDFPLTHDLDRLRGLVPADWEIASGHGYLADLSEWIAQSRYPGDWTEPTEADAQVALTQARAVVVSIEGDFRSRGVLSADVE